MTKLTKFFQHNWIATFYLNFKMLPRKQAIKLPLDVYHKIRFEKLSGRITLNTDKVYRGMVKFGSQGSDMFQHKGCILAIEGDLMLNGSVVFGCSNTIKICKGGFIEIGERSIFGANNLIYCKQNLKIGGDFYPLGIANLWILILIALVMH